MAQDIYYEGKIYVGCKNHERRGVLDCTNIYPVQGQHNFRDGEDVTNRYELEEQFWNEVSWWPTKHLVNGKVKEGTKTRTVAIPIPSAGELELKNIEAYSHDEDICQPIETSTGEQFKKFSLLKDVDSVTSTDTITSAVKWKEESKEVVFVSCSEDDEDKCGTYTSLDGQCLCYVKLLK